MMDKRITSRLNVRTCCPRVAVLAGILFVLAAVPGQPASAQEAGKRHVLLIGGLGGEPAYIDRFGSYLSDVRSLLVNRHGIPATDITVLAENALADRPFVDDVSTAENIRSAFDSIAEAATPDDHVYVMLFGHGSYDGAAAQLNIPRRDLTDADFSALVDQLDAGRIVFVNTASASGPFAASLSGPDRIVIAATATGTQRDETVFPRNLVEALRSPDADLDKSGSLAILEIFRYAAEETARSFQASGRLATEHAVIDDNGDGEPTRFDRLEGSADGALASITHLRPARMLADVSEADLSLLRERESLSREIADLKSRKAAMPEEAYYDALEEVLLSLARLNERLESGGNGTSMP